jgi:hypothetical protein
LRRGLALAALTLACTPVLAACGDDDEESGGSSEAKVAAFELKGKTLTGPKSVEAGLVRIDFKNSSKKEGSAQLIKIEGDHTLEEVGKAGEAWGDKGKALPDWFGLAGGTGITRPGQSASATQVLEPGKYAAVDIDSNAAREFEVTGEGGGEVPTQDATIEAVDYSFNSSGLKAGKADVAFDNKGKEPHFVVGLPIKPGKTIADVKKFIQSEKGEPPVDEKNGSFATAVLDGGLEQTTQVELKKGKYAFLCFIPDRKGGPPHVAKGMVSEATVE